MWIVRHPNRQGKRKEAINRSINWAAGLKTHGKNGCKKLLTCSVNTVGVSYLSTCLPQIKPQLIFAQHCEDRGFRWWPSDTLSHSEESCFSLLWPSDSVQHNEKCLPFATRFNTRASESLSIGPDNSTPRARESQVKHTIIVGRLPNTSCRVCESRGFDLQAPGLDSYLCF